MDKIEPLREELKRLIYELSAYCHDEGCDEVYVCPWHKEACRQKLGLDTSIAWEVCNLLRYVYSLSKSVSDLDTFREKIKTVEQTILSFRFVVIRHSKRFYQLSQLVTDAFYSLRQLNY